MSEVITHPVATDPVQQANEQLAWRLRQSEHRHQDLVRRLETQASTINRLLEEKRQLEQKLTTTVVVSNGKNPQLAVERHRATIDQQRERIHQQNIELRVARDEIKHQDELIAVQRGAIRTQTQTTLSLQEALVELIAEQQGLQNENVRIKRLAEARGHYIGELEDALEDDRSLLATASLEGLQTTAEDLIVLLETVRGVAQEELARRTR